MPIIFLARSAASAGDFASFTPPALPRPPAWICAFTTTIFVPNRSATARACSGVVTISPRGVGTPNRLKISFAWYSWIFIVRPSVLEFSYIGNFRVYREHSNRARRKEPIEFATDASSEQCGCSLAAAIGHLPRPESRPPMLNTLIKKVEAGSDLSRQEAEIAMEE